MNSPDTVHARRDAILAAAGDEMLRARTRRVRRARVATITAVLVLSTIATRFFPRAPSSPRTTRDFAIDFGSMEARTPSVELAIDFARVGDSPRHVDFTLVDSSQRDQTTPMTIEFLTDAEAEQSLLESGYCVKIFRVRNQPVLVDCSTGAPADFGVSRSLIR